jgi:hypothetical protein
MPRLGSWPDLLPAVKSTEFCAASPSDVPSRISLAIRDAMLASSCELYVVCQVYGGRNPHALSWIEIRIGSQQCDFERAIAENGEILHYDALSNYPVRRISRRLIAQFPDNWHSHSSFGPDALLDGQAVTIWIKQDAAVCEFDVSFDDSVRTYVRLQRVLNRLLDRPRLLLRMSGYGLFPL